MNIKLRQTDVKPSELRKYPLEGSDIVYDIRCNGVYAGIVGIAVNYSNIDIRWIEVVPHLRDKGVGYQVIMELLDIHEKDITGDSLPEALPFWIKCGMCNLFEVNNYVELGMCVPFRIKYTQDAIDFIDRSVDRKERAMNKVKVRIVKHHNLAGALAWLGYRYTKDEEGNFIFERSCSFDFAFKDLHALRATYNTSQKGGK